MQMNEEYVRRLISQAIHNERMSELKKYTLGELVEEIENRGCRRFDVEYMEYLTLTDIRGTGSVGGPFIVFRLPTNNDEWKTIETMRNLSPDGTKPEGGK